MIWFELNYSFLKPVRYLFDADGAGCVRLKVNSILIWPGNAARVVNDHLRPGRLWYRPIWHVETLVQVQDQTQSWNIEIIKALFFIFQLTLRSCHSRVRSGIPFWEPPDRLHCTRYWRWSSCHWRCAWSGAKRYLRNSSIQRRRKSRGTLESHRQIFLSSFLSRVWKDCIFGVYVCCVFFLTWCPILCLVPQSRLIYLARNLASKSKSMLGGISYFSCGNFTTALLSLRSPSPNPKPLPFPDPTPVADCGDGQACGLFLPAAYKHPVEQSNLSHVALTLFWVKVSTLVSSLIICKW